MLILTVIQGPDKGRRFELPDHEPQQIGRSSEALPLTDQTISRRHAEMTPDAGRWILRDLGSSNGTFVNGVRVTEARTLQPG
ncbi:MAG: FHA domain-containing protein, partial [Planctomycetota bacterium]